MSEKSILSRLFVSSCIIFCSVAYAQTSTLLGTVGRTVCPGDGTAQIIVDGNSDTLDYAATELVSYASKILHKQWTIGRSGKPLTIYLHSGQSSPHPTGPKEKTIPTFDEMDSYQFSLEGDVVHIGGHNDRSTLYGVYWLIRSWGARFYLSKDVLPETAPCTLPVKGFTRTATLKLRGVNPYPDFLSGPSSWDSQQFEQYIRQLPKLELNFFGLHQYTYESYLNYNVDGTFPRTGHIETSASTVWGYGTLTTCEFIVGRELFAGRPDCVWGSQAALNAKTPEQQYQAGEKLIKGAYTWASKLGLITAFGFEPLVVDPEFQSLAKSDEGLEKITNARIHRTLELLPRLNYVWLFTGEGDQASPDQLHHTYGVIKKAESTIMAAPGDHRLMIGGWNIGSGLAAEDHKSSGIRWDAGSESPVSSSDSYDFHVDTVFTSYGNYDPWTTLKQNLYNDFYGMQHDHAMAAWCEYDGRTLSGMQANVSAYRKMADLNRNTHSLGFFFLHWNTRLCDMNLAYLAQDAWQETPSDEWSFYQGYFNSRFGLNELKTPSWVFSMIEFEKLNHSMSEGTAAFWLMGNEWEDGKASWKSIAKLVDRVRSGERLKYEEIELLQGQIRQAEDIQMKLPALKQMLTGFDDLVSACKTDCDHAAFLRNRARFTIGYLDNFSRVSAALYYLVQASYNNGYNGNQSFWSRLGDKIVGADYSDPELRDGQLIKLERSLLMESWKQTISSYAQMTDDRGELGTLVSLNQKVLYPLMVLKASLKGL